MKIYKNKLANMKPKAGEYKFTMSRTPLNCMGGGECITVQLVHWHVDILTNDLP